MRKVTHGKLIAIREIRGTLAIKHGTTIACPLTTGIFAWVAANAAEEQRQQGKKDITPYWRTPKTNGVVNRKYPREQKPRRNPLKEKGTRSSRKERNL